MQREKTYEGEVCGSGTTIKKALKNLHNSAAMAVASACDWKYDSINLQVTVDRIETSQNIQRYSGESEVSVNVFGKYKAVTLEYL